MFICFNFRPFDVAAVKQHYVFMGKVPIVISFKNHLIQFQPYVENFEAANKKNAVIKSRGLFCTAHCLPCTKLYDVTPD